MDTTGEQLQQITILSTLEGVNHQLKTFTGKKMEREKEREKERGRERERERDYTSLALTQRP